MNKRIKTNEEVRTHFSDSGLSYSDIKLQDVIKLIEILKVTIESHNLSNSKFDQFEFEFPEKQSFLLWSESGTLTKGYISVKYNDSHREGISFNLDGFIGFAGWASSNNTKPFLLAFDIWIDYLGVKKRIENVR